MGTSQRKMSFTEWLMEILKAVYTGEWGDQGEVTEGLVQHRPPCQALSILHSFSECGLNVSHGQALLYAQRKQPGTRQARCFPSWSFYSTKSEGSSWSSPPPPHPCLLPLRTYSITQNSGCSFLLLQLPCYLFLECAHPPHPPAEVPGGQ